jgi:hypothetical protein
MGKEISRHWPKIEWRKIVLGVMSEKGL